jgi:hypothetical protein
MFKLKALFLLVYLDTFRLASYDTKQVVIWRSGSLRKQVRAVCPDASA